MGPVVTNAEANSDKLLVHRLIRPDPQINREQNLFYHVVGIAGYSELEDKYFVTSGGELSFDSYFNSFPLNAYDLSGDLELELRVRIRGRCCVQVIQAEYGKVDKKLAEVALEGVDADAFIPISPTSSNALLFVRVSSDETVIIDDLDYLISGGGPNSVSLRAVITTFKRNDAVQATCLKLQQYFSTNVDLKDAFRLFVVDNGGETKSVPFSQGEVIQNDNYGGAGGFARGLLATVDEGWATHVLFMDDDASFFPETLRRTMSILRYSKHSDLAVSGAMIAQESKQRMWENGAHFDRRCRPYDSGRDLGNFESVLSIASEARPSHKGRYGAWWYFCFPVAAVKHWPFPFFVRGDDIFFSLSNSFRIKNFVGIASHQESFSGKQSPFTIYLDLRNHLVQHLSFGKMEIGRFNLIAMAWSFFFRFNNTYHYESAKAINLALSDLLKGVPFWSEQDDLVERRALFSKFVVNERMRPQFAVELSQVHRPGGKESVSRYLVRRLSLNGHLLPKSLLYSKKALFSPLSRPTERGSFCRKEVIVADLRKGEGYTCHRDSAAYFANLAEFLALAGKVVLNYNWLRKEYGKALHSLASEAFWRSKTSSRPESRSVRQADCSPAGGEHDGC
ncbi:hypothetical protein ACQQ2Q_21520 [Agrobacterium sp. ES01]|uniref:hypothetical protein n=1 Tax=Agrobacterium sp. ES01 TaxID=3420714 RepID=UPI003D10BCBC